MATSPINTSNNTEDARTTYNDIKGPITWDDATWILTSAFIIFTMQSGFGMLEAAAVASKNTVNIMVKNVVDVVFGGMTYWMFGYALSFGEGPYTNPFCGLGDFFVDTNSEEMGILYATFVFQLSFATTATTIVSGAMAERTNLTAYIVFSFFNTIVYCIPAHWIWSAQGFLGQLGAVDFAGSGVVHMVGACSGLVATLMLKPRTGRYAPGQNWPSLINPVNAIIGTFMLWWGWLAFNCGSTFGISGGKWMLASKAAFTTLIASMSGGITGIVVSVVDYIDLGEVKRYLRIAAPSSVPSDRELHSSFVVKKGKYDVSYLINAILGSLVAITASCPLVRPYEAVMIGTVGALCTLGWCSIMDKLKVDDPVSAVAVHGASGMWGLVAVGLFVEDDNVEDLTGDRNGLLKGGGFYLLGVQLLCIVCETAWAALITFVLLMFIDKTIGLRISVEEERLGADYCEHGVFDPSLHLSQQLHPSSTPPGTSFYDSKMSLVSSATSDYPPDNPSVGVCEDEDSRRPRRHSTATSRGSMHDVQFLEEPPRDTTSVPSGLQNGIQNGQNGVKVRKNMDKIKKNRVKVKTKNRDANEGGLVNEVNVPNGTFTMESSQERRRSGLAALDDILPNSVLPL